MEELKESYKGAYPFRLGTTSFIYPDLYSENVRKLGPYLDEIELLFFESSYPESLPDDYQIKKLSELKEEFDISYNIHLPTDVSIADSDPVKRGGAADTIMRFIDATSVLGPTTCTLHIPYGSYGSKARDVWKECSFKGIETLLAKGVDPRLISVETLDYDPFMLEEITKEFNLSICLDIGHLIVHGFDSVPVYQRFKDRISIIHLHGVDNWCDHVSLDLMADSEFQKARNILGEFSGTVSIEVFSLNDLKPSLEFLKKNL